MEASLESGAKSGKVGKKKASKKAGATVVRTPQKN